MSNLNSLILILRAGNTGERGGQKGNDNAAKAHQRVDWDARSPFMADPDVRNSARKSVQWGRDTVMSTYGAMSGVKPEHAEDANPSAVRWYMRGTPDRQRQHIRNMMEIDWLLHHEHLSPIVNHFGGGSEGLARASQWLANSVRNSFRHDAITQRVYGKNYMASGTPHTITMLDKVPDGARVINGQFSSPKEAFRAGQRVISTMASHPDMRDADVLGIVKNPTGGYRPVVSYRKTGTPTMPLRQTENYQRKSMIIRKSAAKIVAYGDDDYVIDIGKGQGIIVNRVTKTKSRPHTLMTIGAMSDWLPYTGDQKLIDELLNASAAKSS